jgi:hypothetical protein
MWWHCHRGTDTRNWRENSAMANQVPRTQHTQLVHRLFGYTLYLQSRFEIEVPGHICFSVGKWWGNNFCPNLCQLFHSLRWSNFWAWEIYQKSVQNPRCKQLQCLACLKSANAIACLLACKGEKKKEPEYTHISPGEHIYFDLGKSFRSPCKLVCHWCSYEWYISKEIFVQYPTYGVVLVSNW